jgi:hypothetical protein
MREISPNILYSRADLIELFGAFGLDGDTVLGRIKARKVFRTCWLGSDLLDALRTAPALNEPVGERAESPRRRGRRRKAGKVQEVNALDALIQETKKRA